MCMVNKVKDIDGKLDYITSCLTDLGFVLIAKTISHRVFENTSISWQVNVNSRTAKLDVYNYDDVKVLSESTITQLISIIA